MSLWDNIVNKKYYVTGGVGSGETSEGFGPNYSLRNNAYCESCSSCGEIFFQCKMNLAYHDARYADLYEETLYNALLGSIDLEGKNFYYDNPLDANDRALRLARLPVLRRQHPAHAADDADLDVRQGRRRHLRQPVRRQHDQRWRTWPAPMSRWCRRPIIPWNGKVSITVNPEGREDASASRIRVPNRNVSDLYTKHAGRPTASRPSRSTAADQAGDREGLRRDHAHLEGRRQDRTGAADEGPAREGAATRSRRPRDGWRCATARWSTTSSRSIRTSPRRSARLAPLTTEWKDLLGGVMVIKGAFADGTPLMAIPNYARTNRDPAPPPAAPPPPSAAPAAGGAPPARPAPPPATSIVWLREQ